MLKRTKKVESKVDEPIKTSSKLDRKGMLKANPKLRIPKK